MIDLAFLNIPHAIARIIGRLHPGRDHEGILIIVPQPRGIYVERRRPAIPDSKLETFANLVELGIGSLPRMPRAPDTSDLDIAIAAILAALADAA
jgi:hypothetical protein